MEVDRLALLAAHLLALSRRCGGQRHGILRNGLPLALGGSGHECAGDVQPLRRSKAQACLDRSIGGIAHGNGIVAGLGRPFPTGLARILIAQGIGVPCAHRTGVVHKLHCAPAYAHAVDRFRLPTCDVGDPNIVRVGFRLCKTVLAARGTVVVKRIILVDTMIHRAHGVVIARANELIYIIDMVVRFVIQPEAAHDHVLRDIQRIDAILPLGHRVRHRILIHQRPLSIGKLRRGLKVNGLGGDFFFLTVGAPRSGVKVVVTIYTTCAYVFLVPLVAHRAQIAFVSLKGLDYVIICIPITVGNHTLKMDDLFICRDFYAVEAVFALGHRVNMIIRVICFPLGIGSFRIRLQVDGLGGDFFLTVGAPRALVNETSHKHITILLVVLIVHGAQISFSTLIKGIDLVIDAPNRSFETIDLFI